MKLCIKLKGSSSRQTGALLRQIGSAQSADQSGQHCTQRAAMRHAAFLFESGVVSCRAAVCTRMFDWLLFLLLSACGSMLCGKGIAEVRQRAL